MILTALFLLVELVVVGAAGAVWRWRPRTLAVALGCLVALRLIPDGLLLAWLAIAKAAVLCTLRMWGPRLTAREPFEANQ